MKTTKPAPAPKTFPTQAELEGRAADLAHDEYAEARHEAYECRAVLALKAEQVADHMTRLAASLRAATSTSDYVVNVNGELTGSLVHDVNRLSALVCEADERAQRAARLVSALTAAGIRPSGLRGFPPAAAPAGGLSKCGCEPCGDFA